MAPKNKFTKEEMTEAALRVVRQQGLDGLTAKTMADALGTSTQPVFTAVGSMDGVRQAVYPAATNIPTRACGREFRSLAWGGNTSALHGKSRSFTGSCS